VENLHPRRGPSRYNGGLWRRNRDVSRGRKPAVKQNRAANFWWAWEARASQRGDWGRSPQPYPRRGPLSAPTPRYIGWGDALNVSRALAPSGGGGGRAGAGVGRKPPPERKRARNWSEPAPGNEERRLKQSGAANFRWVWEALASQRGTGGGAPSLIQGGGLYRAPRWAAFYGGTRSMFRAHSRTAGGVGAEPLKPQLSRCAAFSL
jgi:hypothetical protein